MVEKAKGEDGKGFTRMKRDGSANSVVCWNDQAVARLVAPGEIGRILFKFQVVGRAGIRLLRFGLGFRCAGFSAYRLSRLQRKKKEDLQFAWM